MPASDQDPQEPQPQRSLRERRKLATRRELVDATLEIIRADGVDAAGVGRIARDAGMARATLYAHFPGGRDELLREAYGALGQRLVAETMSAVGADRSLIGAATAIADAMLALAQDSALGHFYNVSGPALIPAGSSRGAGSFATRTVLREVIASAREAGEVGSDVDPEATAAQLVGALRQMGQDAASGTVAAKAHRRAFRRLVEGLLS